MSAATYRAKELAERLGVCEWTVYELARKGGLPAGLEPLRLGRRLVWPRAAVDRVLGENGVEV